MNEWHNLALAVLLVVVAEIANEMIIALFRVKNAATRFRIRLISFFSCFFVFLVLPLRIIELVIPFGDSALTSGDSPYILGRQAMLASRLSRFAWVSIILLAAAAFCFVIMLLASRRIVSSTLSCEPTSDSRLLRLVEDMSSEMGVTVHQVMISRKKCDAFVYGYPPSLAIGRDLLSILDDEELRIIIRHELYHVKGRDTLLKPLFTALCITFLYNPMVWFLYKRLFTDRECCADRGVLTSSQDTRTFLSLLLKFQSLGNENSHSFAVHWMGLPVHWMGATDRLDSLFSNEKARKIPVLVCLFFTFSSLFVGGTQLFGERYLEIDSSASIDSAAQYYSRVSNLPDYFLDIPLAEWYQKKNEPQRVRILLQESELVELLKVSEFSEGGVTITIRLAAVPIGRRRQLFGGNDIVFDANSHLVIDADPDGKLFVSLETIQQEEGEIPPGMEYPHYMYSHCTYNPRNPFAWI